MILRSLSDEMRRMEKLWGGIEGSEAQFHQGKSVAFRQCALMVDKWEAERRTASFWWTCFKQWLGTRFITR